MEKERLIGAIRQLAADESQAFVCNPALGCKILGEPICYESDAIHMFQPSSFPGHWFRPVHGLNAPLIQMMLQEWGEMADPGGTIEELMVEHILKIAPVMVGRVVHFPDICGCVPGLVEHGYHCGHITHGKVVMEYTVLGDVQAGVESVPGGCTYGAVAIAVCEPHTFRSQAIQVGSCSLTLPRATHSTRTMLVVHDKENIWPLALGEFLESSTAGCKGGPTRRSVTHEMST